MRRPLSYTFGPLPTGGLLGGVSAAQLAVGALAAVVAVVALDLDPTAGGLGIAVVSLIAGAALAALPFGERPLCGWGPVLAGYTARRPWSGWRSGQPGGGRPGAAPPAVRGVTVADHVYRGRTVGVLADAGGRYLTAVLACRAGSFAMLDTESRERRLARWGEILAGTANGAVRRIAWIERTAPARSDELVRHLGAERDPALPAHGTPLIDSYLELIDSSTRVGQEHEVLLAVQLDARRATGDARDALVAETERIAVALEAAEVSVLGALPAQRLAAVLRTAFDPYARPELAALMAAGGGPSSEDPSAPWPLAVRERWDRFTADGAEHATWWIAGWPRIPVSPMFMESLLARSLAVRTVAVVFEPVPPGRSTREVEAQITRDRADRELRRRLGQSDTARRRQAEEATARREAELAQGHAEVRFAGFVTVSGRTPAELTAGCAEVVEQAARSRLELRRMYGQQAEAFSFTLPLCRGLR